ncbi:MAG: UPF0225 protein YchJ, partial [uncultured Blastococcus sp.]
CPCAPVPADRDCPTPSAAAGCTGARGAPPRRSSSCARGTARSPSATPPTSSPPGTPAPGHRASTSTRTSAGPAWTCSPPPAGPCSAARERSSSGRTTWSADGGASSTRTAASSARTASGATSTASPSP